jgi:hypothetical protein
MQMYSSDTIPTLAPDEILGIGNGERKFTYQGDVDHSAVFSSKDFTCCTPLGMTPKTGSFTSCCSGYGVTNSAGKFICKLPNGTDLNVYFNRFVSNEGVGTALPGVSAGVGFIDSTVEPETDFNKYTGEPKMRDSTYSTINTLGIAYCDKGKVTAGGVFGKYTPQPNTGTFNSAGYNPTDYPTSIIDSVNDNLGGYLSQNGFNFGVRWNHHYYCSQ